MNIYMDITVGAVLIHFLMILSPIWTSVLVGCVAGWALPRLWIIAGGFVGFVAGIPNVALMIWINTKWYDIEHWGPSRAISVPVAVAITIVVCWWLNRREKARLQT